MININSLNDKQKEAVSITEGPLLILAGAGAGKTKTITHRILELVRKGVAPHAILGITFTNKASKEMRERIYRLIEEDKTLNLPVSMTERPFMTTFHSLGVHILKENASILGLTKHFTIYDRGDSKKVVKDCLEALGYESKEFDPYKILSAISRNKGDFKSASSFIPEIKDFLGKIVKSVWEKYDAQLRKEHALDFDDLLLRTAELLRDNPKVREYYQKKWQYIHIDEYQDTNKVQYEIAHYLAGAHNNICVVGDIDQNIYSWRGADIQNILNFEKDYPSAKVILLEENYRSTKTIIAAANQIIEKNILRRDKRLFTNNEVGEKITLIENLTENDEARTVSERVRTLMANGVDTKNIAVLYRANFQSRVLEEAFLKKNIPYQLLGTKFFERKEIKDMLSFLRSALNRESTADLVRIINVPTRGIGKATIMKVLANEEGSLSSAMQAKVSQFYNFLDSIVKIIPEKTASEVIIYILKTSGLEQDLRSGKGEDLETLENIGELVTLAKKYDHMQNGEGIEALLTDAALATDQDELKEEKNGVKLMTVHASKGLEFDYVFICGLEKELFPHVRLDENEMTQSEAEEERRLFYVALTRAKKKLFLLFARTRTIFGTQRFNEPSEFIGDLEGNLLEQEEIEEPRGIKAIFLDF
ncbi:MAG: UvrD-helicase domain-containing protein [Candidatus Taylorbacteria bacterium]|nr:UvrD-helicase domain-containing protein [Candidatus Taylorbacteria bacterium]